MPNKDGGPAFPHLSTNCQRVGESEYYEGLALRDWFAGQALVGFVTHHSVEPMLMPELTAKACYILADAMLKSREKGQGR